MRIALTKMNQVWEDKSANIDICDSLAESASKYEAELIVFPEMTLTGFSMNTVKLAEHLSNSLTLRKFSELASKYRIGIVGGLVIEEDNKYFNVAVAISREGEVLCRYAKIHPFSPAGEGCLIQGGEHVQKFLFGEFNFAMTICYDLRFPLIWNAVSENCDCIINIANWPSERLEHWRTLLQARAIENQVFVIGVNRVGADGNGHEYTESSYAFAPEGAMVSPVIDTDGYCIIDIDKLSVAECRKNFPQYRDRRSNLYRKLLLTES